MLLCIFKLLLFVSKCEANFARGRLTYKVDANRCDLADNARDAMVRIVDESQRCGSAEKHL